MNSLDHKGCGDPQKARETKFSASLPLHRPSPPPRFNYCPTNLTNPPTPSPHHRRPSAPPSACPHIIYTSTATLKSIMPRWRYYPENQRPSSSDWNRCLLHLLRSHLLTRWRHLVWMKGGMEWILSPQEKETEDREHNKFDWVVWRWAVASIRTNNTTTNRYKNWGERRSLMKWGMIWGTISTLIVIIEFNYLRCYVYNTLYQ
jgi:hypothetical protein